MTALAAAETTSRPRTAAVAVTGELDLATVERLRVRLDDALSQRPDRLVVDLGRCAFVDATALNVLLEAHRTALRQGGQLVLRGVGPRVVRVLALTGLTHVLTVEPQRARAW